MQKYIKPILVSLIVILVQTTNLFALAERYQIINLDLQKYGTSKATSINNQGWICGLLSDNQYLKIFVLDQDHNIVLRSEPRTSASLIINNSNEVFGSAIYRVSGSYLFQDWIYDEEQVFKWSNPFKYFQYLNFYYLGCPKGQSSAPYNFKTNAVWDANDLGQVVVMNCETNEAAMNEFNKTTTWLSDGGTFVKIADAHFQAGFKINNRSQILGCYYTGSSLSHDRQQHLSIYNYQDKTTRLLDFPSDSLGTDLNDNGQVVGSFYSPEDQIWKGFLAEPTGEIFVLEHFSPWCLNNQGVILGVYTNNAGKESVSLWENGYFYNIMDLVSLVDDKGNVWDSILIITDINDDGCMIGQGKIGGATHSFLLKPL